MDYKPKDLNKLVPLFNPLLTDFSYEWFDDENKPHTLVMRAREITRFPAGLVDFMVKHMTDEVINIRGIKENVEIDTESIKKEILMK